MPARLISSRLVTLDLAASCPSTRPPAAHLMMDFAGRNGREQCSLLEPLRPVQVPILHETVDMVAMHKQVLNNLRMKAIAIAPLFPILGVGHMKQSSCFARDVEFLAPR